MANKYTKTKINVSQIVELYESGMTQVEIAEHLNTSQKVIWSRFKEIKYKCRSSKKRNQLGENNNSWKGEKAGYKAKHYRIYKKLGCPRKCEECGESDPNKRYEWANLTGKYDDPEDYKRMCKKCHHQKDISSHKKGINGKFIAGEEVMLHDN